MAAVAAIADATRRAATPSRRGDEPIAALALVVPSLTVSEVPDALRADPEAWQTRQRQVLSYLGTRVDAQSPWVSPALLPALRDMPPTFAVVAAHDEIAVGGHRLAELITDGGGTAIVREYDMTHTTAPPRVEAAVVTDVCNFVREHTGATPQVPH